MESDEEGFSVSDLELRMIHPDSINTSTFDAELDKILNKYEVSQSITTSNSKTNNTNNFAETFKDQKKKFLKARKRIISKKYISKDRKHLLQGGSYHFFLSKKSAKAKPEYIRLKLIRSHKKFQRSVLSGKTQYRTLKRPKLSDLKQQRLIKFIRDHAEDFERSCKVDNTCRNNEGMQNYMLLPYVATSLIYYISVLCTHRTCKQLSKDFSIFCCKTARHTNRCQYKWRMFKLDMKHFVEINCNLFNPAELAPQFN